MSGRAAEGKPDQPRRPAPAGGLRLHASRRDPASERAGRGAEDTWRGGTGDGGGPGGAGGQGSGGRGGRGARGGGGWWGGQGGRGGDEGWSAGGSEDDHGGGRGGWSGGDFDGGRPAWRRLLGPGDNPLTWSLPLGVVAGITVRISLLFVLFAVVQLASAAFKGGLVLPWTAAAMAWLFVLVLLHEFGHCFACRRVGGEADEILMWPLGGLAFCIPPRNWRAYLVTTVGGPAVNVALAPVLAGALLAAGVPLSGLFFNPLDPYATLQDPSLGIGASWLRAILWLGYVSNLALLVFNLIVPMYPMDGARICQEILWRYVGYRRSMQIAVDVGLVTAVALALVGLTTGGHMLVGLALFGGITCYVQRQQLRFMEDGEGEGESIYAASLRPDPAEERERKAAQAKAAQAASEEQRRLQREQDEEEELNRILDKIRVSGRESLSRPEQRTLERATERRRRG